MVAHIRHVYTDYDRLLKQKSFHEARSAVEQATLKKVIQWRGDDENGQTVLEDVFREVIVISDDEDSETEEDLATATSTRNQSVEILSSNARIQDVQTQPVNVGIPTNEDLARELSEDAPPGFRYIARMPAKKTIDRRGFSRYQAWNRALHRFRAEAQGAEQARLGDAPAEQQSPRNSKRSAAAQELSDPVRRRDTAPQSMEYVSRAEPGPIPVNRPVQGMPGVPPTDKSSGKSHVGTQQRQILLESPRAFPQYGLGGRPFPLTTQQPSEVRPLEKNPRPSGNIVYFQSTSHADLGPNCRIERIPVPSDDRANAPVFVSGPKELQQIGETQVGSRTGLPLSYHPRSSTIPQDHVLPSIESPWPPEKRFVDGRLEQLTKRMSLRSVTPVHVQGDSSQNGNAGPPGSPDDPNVKRRRIAHYAPRPDSRPDNWNARPNHVPISQGLSPRGQYRREELVPGHRSQDAPYLRRDYLPQVEQPPVVGYPRERKPLPLAAAPASQDVRPLDRARPSTLEEPYAPVWKPYTDGDRPFHGGAPPGGKQYADGFVRHVDIREVRPVEYLIQRPRPQPAMLGIPDHYDTRNLSQVRASSEQCRPPSPRVAAQKSHDQLSRHPEAIPGSHKPHGSPRQRRPGSGLSTSR